MSTEYPYHKGAKTALNISAVLCCLIIVGIPLGIWIFIRTAAARITLTPTALRAKGLFLTPVIEYSDVDRLGMLKVPILAKGLGGALARQRMGGDEGTHLVVRTKDGKNKSIMVSSYEGMDEVFRAVSEATGKPVEPVTTGLMGVSSTKWS